MFVQWRCAQESIGDNWQKPWNLYTHTHTHTHARTHAQTHARAHAHIPQPSHNHCISAYKRASPAQPCTCVDWISSTCWVGTYTVACSIRMESSLIRTLLNILFLSSLECVLGSVVRQDSYFNKYPSSWTDAVDGCRYSDIVNLENNKYILISMLISVLWV